MTYQEGSSQKPVFSQAAEQDLTNEQLESVVAAGAFFSKVFPGVKQFIRIKGKPTLESSSSSAGSSVSSRASSRASSRTDSSVRSISSDENTLIGWHRDERPILRGSSSDTK